MFRHTLLLGAIALCLLCHALHIEGDRLRSTIQELKEDGQTKRILTSLKSNSIEMTAFGEDSSSWGQPYYAVHQTTSGGPGDSYYGLHVTTDVYSHNLKPGQQTSTAIWVNHVGDGVKSSLNTISIGWHIYPEHYGDSHPHFYTDWTRDGYAQTGCLNMDCPGFIRVNGAVIAPGDVIHPVSGVPGGRVQNITLRLHKDKTSGDWWVYYGLNGIPTGVGYFPRSLFTYLAEKANHVAFGAFVDAEKALPTPPMGSGVLPNGGKGHAASFTNLQLIDKDGNSSPIKANLPELITMAKCHSITHIDHSQCLYGGPGGCV
ncbi:hypothetical protein CFC21_068861 [Triticum aestivum]|uniref:Neprosin PEP catalytic domain-containing protein n=4 Tax=Triticum TaxID=4564 RepID=A0A9R0U4U8_TRITD|nr:uncharacterized protein LOC123108330 [Triticum aestivum]KAF7062236.1 hypothetical protein CFC21_068861 [Triticum aestivum]VAI24859.1 unnamed protein product [Triticum turgidum subsp. durum]